MRVLCARVGFLTFVAGAEDLSRAEDPKGEKQSVQYRSLDPTIQTVILSAAGTSRSEVPAQSKDPHIPLRGKDASGNSPRRVPHSSRTLR